MNSIVADAYWLPNDDDCDDDDKLHHHHECCTHTVIFLTIFLKAFDVPVVLSATGAEFINDGSWDTVFVLEEFSGPVYDAIHRSEQRFV